jgi:Family of unknown function (DUF6516)
MLPDALRLYFEEVESALQKLKDVYVEVYQEEILADDRANLRIRVRFAQGCLLELNEAVMIEAGVIRHLGYRYHFQDERNELIFRYDNTPHFPGLNTFPHHKHLQAGVLECERPSIPRVFEEAASCPCP